MTRLRALLLRSRALHLSSRAGTPSANASSRKNAAPRQPPAAEAKPAPATPLPAAHPLEKADLEAFFDGLVPLQMERSDVAGATVLVMKDGKELLKKGYGYSDITKKDARRSGHQHVSPGFDLETFHLGFRHAARRARQAGHRRRRKQLSRFPDRTGLRQTHHSAQLDDPHRRLRRGASRHYFRRPQESAHRFATS